MNISRRIAKFYMPKHLIEDFPDAVISAMAGCIVVRAELVWWNDSIEYCAISENFMEVPHGEMMPMMSVVIDNFGDDGVKISIVEMKSEKYERDYHPFK